ncbi:MAG: hypothetical protein LQ349_004650 [Xanthoria aureola]|nr:MAG: hypothetical protein LQ349_004650 [Xanthoria aureola]
MTRNKELLDEVQQTFKSIMPIPDESQEAHLLEELVGKVQTDMEYIEIELPKIEMSIERLRKEIEAQSSLPSRMPTMITILAATYVPLAFVTVRTKDVHDIPI